MGKMGVNSDYLKRSNRGLALKLIATGQCSSRIELARTMGLTKTTISTIAGELIARGILAEAEKHSSGEPGPKPVGLTLGPAAPKYAGLLIQRRYAEAVVCDLHLQALTYLRVDRVWEDSDELMAALYGLLDRLFSEYPDIHAIGVSSIGQVDVNRGRILSPLYFNGIHDVDITEPIARRYKRPVFFDHDNQSAALAEYLYGNGRGYQDILMIGIGQGVGCGIIADGRRYQNHSGLAPEIGHMTIDIHGKRCRCGNIGCVETYTMSPVIEAQVEAATGRRMTYREICRSADEAEIDAIMTEMVHNLSGAVVSLMNILNFELVVLSLDSIYWPDRYVLMLQDLINRRRFAGRDRPTLVAKASFMEKAQVLGAACNAIHQTFEGNLVEDLAL